MSIRGQGSLLDKLTVSSTASKALDELTLCVDRPVRCAASLAQRRRQNYHDGCWITGKTRPDSGTARFWPRLEMLELPIG